MDLKKLDEIPRGNTCPGVNRTIIEYLLSRKIDLAGEYVLDIPCGSGAFLQAVSSFYPESERIGADIKAPASASPDFKFVKIDAREKLSFGNERKFKLISVISGVMEFDNTLAFFEQLKEQIDDEGTLIVTNDNLLSVRDRFLYLLFGRYKQYPLFIANDAPTWKTLSLHNLLRILRDAGFEPVEVEYVPVKAAEYLWLPLAAFIYVFQYLYLLFAESDVPFEKKSSLYPFASLLARHYIIGCRIAEKS